MSLEYAETTRSLCSLNFFSETKPVTVLNRVTRPKLITSLGSAFKSRNHCIVRTSISSNRTIKMIYRYASGEIGVGMQRESESQEVIGLFKLWFSLPMSSPALKRFDARIYSNLDVCRYVRHE